jgi:hypothetical protein
MVQGNSVGQRFSFGDGGEGVDEYGVVLADDLGMHKSRITQERFWAENRRVLRDGRK